METTVITQDFSTTLLAPSVLELLEETASTPGFQGHGEQPAAFDLAKTPLEDDEDEDEDEDDDLEDENDDDLEDDDLDDEDEDDDLEDDEDDDEDEDDEELEDDDDPKPLRVKTRT